MVRNIRERVGSLLPATVMSSELVSDTVLVIHAGAMGLQIWDAFAGQDTGETIWNEMNPQGLIVRSKAFKMNRLLAVDGGPDWLHLDFASGWIRIVTDTWEPWSIILPGIWWTGGV